MPPFTYRSADQLDAADLADAFNRSFEHYFVPMNLTPESFTAMNHINDVRLDRSLVAYTANGELAGVAMLAIRGDRGWVGGIGLVPEQRGKRHSKALLERLLDVARRASLRQVSLEVLKDNVAAQALYLGAGFRVLRPVEIFIGTIDVAMLPAAQSAPAGEIQSITLAEALALHDEMEPVAATWQREATSLGKTPSVEGLAYYTANDEQPLAYVLYSIYPQGYVLFDLGIKGKGIARPLDSGLRLMQELHARLPQATYRAIDIPSGDRLGAVLQALGCPTWTLQYEMAVELT
ncbi:MAG TPA: GNAT family N-acetyltransferase [Ktedonobacterales bacterium]|jgi:ribosomal protein S18 acetylase RimI-like enzyme|nr:GNAT family N-acetyltransferase [Ktedonobacterales bacterium]